MAKMEFKAESRRLLDLMINSIYTHKEIFLRELISNASDAIDKNYYRSLTDPNVVFNKEDFYIEITADRENRILRIADNGIGMTKEDLEENLGTIAQSGSFSFKSETESKEGVDIIGQFGVGFYSAFMVSDLVTVISRSVNSEQAYKWESRGAEGFEIEEAEKAVPGTEIILKIKENTEDEKYDR
jgi:molecular chaperone HtpG